jgi:signal transduction histidine kinase
MTGSSAMPKGGQLSLYSRLQNDMINIEVKDSGVGITPENMKKLFEPLFTTKAKGIGLGLAVSRKLIEANGGRIEVESEAGKGSSFSVFLPIDKELK